MTEEKQGKKKHGLCWQIFKWIGLGLLSLLIIAATFFHVPWKVITLLLITLAACTALPKPARKWFWLSAAAVVIALIIWVFLPDDTEGWRPYTCDEELAALEAKYAIPDEENAAIIYNNLFEDFDIDSNQPEFFIRLSPSSINEPWLSKDHPETAEWLKNQQSTIETLMQASKIEQCRFSIPSDHFTFGESMKRLAPMRQCAFLLVSAANNDIAEGCIQQVIEKNFAILQMAKHQYQQPTAIEIIVGIAIERLSTKQLRHFIVTSDVTEEHLRVIENYLAGIEHDWSCDVHKFIEHDRLMAKSNLSSFYQINSRGKTRLSRDPLAQFRALLKEKSNANQIEDQETIDFLNSLEYPTYWHKKLTKAGIILKWFFMPSTPQKAAKIIDAAYERYYAMAEPDFDWQREPPELLSFITRCNFLLSSLSFNYLIEYTTALGEGPYYSLHDSYLQSIAEQRGTLLIIALSRYKNENGRWPEGLDSVKGLAAEEIFVDPISGDAFVYKLIDEDFTLYSTGKNGIDEGGIHREVVDPNAAKEPVDPNFYKEMLEIRVELEPEFIRELIDPNFSEEIPDINVLMEMLGPNVLKEMFDPNDYRPKITVEDDLLIWPLKHPELKEEDPDDRQQ